MEGRPVVLYRGLVPTTSTELFKNNSENSIYVITGVSVGNSSGGNIGLHIDLNDITFTDNMTISSKEIKSWSPNAVLELNDSLSMFGSAVGLVVSVDGLLYWS